MITVLLADDHVMVRDAIAAALAQSGDVNVVAVADDGREAIQKAASSHPDVSVLDVFMPLLNGLEAARMMTDNAPRAPSRAILLSEHLEKRDIVSAVRAGVRGYLWKTRPLLELLHAIRVVAAGGVYFNPAAADTPTTEGALETGLAILSPREHQVLQLVAEGKSTKEISSLLLVKPKTVEHHRERLMSRLDIHDVAGLTRYAVRQGIILP